MALSRRFDPYLQGSPITVMVRAISERALGAEALDALFERTADRQYTRTLLFSSLVGLMSDVVLGISPSVRAAYQDSAESLPVSLASVYNKLNGLETDVSAELVRHSANQLGPVVRRMRGAAPDLLPGYQVRILDGNHLAGTEHRIEELRTIGAAALPGQSLVVLDPALMMAIDVFPCEDGHAQERSLLKDVLPTIQPNEVWIDDRNFCTTMFLFGIRRQKAYFLVRQHAATLHWKLAGKRKYRGRTETGEVYEQTILLDNPQTGETLVARRITVELDEPTRDGESEIHLLTNLPAAIRAKRVARLYAKRWSIETMFLELTTALVCEINTLGYPRAALFGFCLALVAYNVVSLVQAALRAVHGHQKVEEELSWYYVCMHVGKVYEGMMIAVPDRCWTEFRRMSDREFAQFLKNLATNINMARFRKHRRGPKRPPPKRSSGAKTKHVSTARVLAQRAP